MDQGETDDDACEEYLQYSSSEQSSPFATVLGRPHPKNTFLTPLSHSYTLPGGPFVCIRERLQQSPISSRRYLGSSVPHFLQRSDNIGCHYGAR